MPDDSDSLLFGCVTYELFESYWPSVATDRLGTERE